ncbi:MAG TPA: outer membrane beta-barrel protein [Saprospiraceae bacterium]|nr:outer membrane beta-barrel protein [Saprospiraceae bacterium]HMQ85245.1 outer membrane beta-barrel protein [Saprospiraceae bacterium]
MKVQLTRLFFLVALFCLSHYSFSQSSLSGQVISDAGKAAETVNVLLYSATDSIIVKMELSESDGSYRFRQLDTGDYYLQVTGIGYSDYFSERFALAEKEEKVLPLIELESGAEMLSEVEVTAKKPLLEQRAGRLIVNVDQNITGQGGSVTDLLKKVPGLVVVNNRISMAGRSGVTILIDGRPTKYMDIESLLREMPADNIARIEVISQPGAAFDAEGTGGVINIILKKNALLGTNGNVSLGVGYGELWKYRLNGAVNHRSGPWNLSLSTGYNNRTWVERLDLERILPDRSYVQNNYEPGDPRSVYLRLGADYSINDKQTIGINLHGSRSNNERTNTNETVVVSKEGVELERFVTDNVQDRFWRSYTADLFYRWKIDTLGQELSFDANYANYHRDALSELMTTGADFEPRRNDEPAETYIYASQLDYKLPLSKKLLFQTGGKISATRLDNELIASLFINNNWTNDVLRSNTFKYDEDIYAAYTSFTYTQDKLEINVGLRYEDSHAVGFSETLDSTIDLTIRKLFPSASINAPLFGPMGLSLSYSYRIERPGYYDLNPFVSYLDPLTFSKGNPFLIPELTHSGQISLTYEKQPFFNLSYDYTSDVLTEVIEQDDETGEAFQTDINLDQYIRYGGSLFFPLDFIAKPISGYGGFMLFYHDYQAEYLNSEYLQNQWTTNAFLQVNVSLPQEWKLEVTGWFQGKGLDGIIRHESMYGVDAGIQKKFLDDQLRFELSADGIIQKFFQGKVDYANLDFNILSQWEAPIFQTRITWNFGNKYLKDRENRKAASEAERQRAQGN